MKRLNIKYLHAIIFALLIVLFCYFRLKPLYYQTVVYTYDQGRDFLKAAEIVLYKNPTFIGPTTGIMGIYHGAWWYYVLALPFIIFHASPIGFYYFQFMIYLLTFILSAYFIYRLFGSKNALLFSAIVATSPYFSFVSTFVGNNALVPPFFLFLLISMLFIFTKTHDKKNLLLFFMNGLFLGMSAEFEFAFGLFLVPSYILLILLFPSVRKKFLHARSFISFFLGSFIAFAPRILFEVKHQFEQTKTLLGFFLHPKFFTPKPYGSIFHERIQLFQGYFYGIFQNHTLAFCFIALGTVCVILLFHHKKTRSEKMTPFVFFSCLLVLLFTFSVLYRDSFWGYYYEGIQFLFLIIFLTLLSLIQDSKFISLCKTLFIILIVGGSLIHISADIRTNPKTDGLKIQSNIISYITTETNTKEPYCVRIYTPPVIPYTYNYLFLAHKLSTHSVSPDTNWTNKSCWFIIESDDNKERRAKWLTDNIPEKTKIAKSKLFDKTIVQFITLP